MGRCMAGSRHTEGAGGHLTGTQVQHALEQDDVIDITTRGRNTGSHAASRSGMPTCWHIPSLPSICSRAYRRTCQPGRSPFWSRPDVGRSSRPFIRNAVSIKSGPLVAVELLVP
jgi:hypothetical protein